MLFENQEAKLVPKTREGVRERERDRERERERREEREQVAVPSTHLSHYSVHIS